MRCDHVGRYVPNLMEHSNLVPHVRRGLFPVKNTNFGTKLKLASFSITSPTASSNSCLLRLPANESSTYKVDKTFRARGEVRVGNTKCAYASNSTVLAQTSPKHMRWYLRIALHSVSLLFSHNGIMRKLFV